MNSSDGLTLLNHPERIPLMWGSTPLHGLARLGGALGLDLSVKRDDLTGSHLSGNKVRKLEYLLAEALAAGATHVVTCGGVQSNHCRAVAMAAAPLGLSPVLLLRTSCGTARGLPQPPTGNVLLARLAGARIETISPEGYRARASVMASFADEIRASGGVPYLIPEGGSNALGSWGYIRCARELLAQSTVAPDTVVVATGSGGTLAGLALGFETLGVSTRVVGIAVCDDRAYFRGIVDRIAEEAASRWGLAKPSSTRYEVDDRFVGRGYARTTAEELAFLRDAVREDGLVLDPVYSNKALRGLVQAVRAEPATFGRRVVFIHTGGIFGLFPAAEALSAVLEEV